MTIRYWTTLTEAEWLAFTEAEWLGFEEAPVSATADLFEDAFAWISTQRTAHNTQTVSYERPGTGTIASVIASPGRTEWEQDESEAGLVTFESRDFLIDADALNFGSGATEPQRGDLITFDGQPYECMNPAGAPPWRYTDAYERTFRIHTKQVPSSS